MRAISDHCTSMLLAAGPSEPGGYGTQGDGNRYTTTRDRVGDGETAATPGPPPPATTSAPGALACVERRIVPGSSLFSIARSSSGVTCTGDGNGCIGVWRDGQDDAVAGLRPAPRSPPAVVSCLHWLADTNTVASGSHDTKLRLWDVQQLCQLWLLTAHIDWITDVASVRPSMPVSCSLDGMVCCWDVRSNGTASAVSLVSSSHPAPLTSLAVMPQQAAPLVLAGDVHGSVYVWDIRVPATPFQVLSGRADAITALCVVSAAQRRMAVASADATVSLVDLDGVEDAASCLNGQLAQHTERVTSLAMLGDRHMASAGFDHAICLWDLASSGGSSVGSSSEQAVCRARATGHTGIVEALASAPSPHYNADAAILVSASDDASFRAWSLR